MGRQSSVRGDFVRVKTLIGLEQFEVGKSRGSYDVPFRSDSFDRGDRRQVRKKFA